MKTQIILTILFSFFFIGWHCGSDDNPVTPKAKSPGFYGTIQDENGNAVKDVNVYYNFTCRALAKVSDAKSNIAISFSVNETSFVVLSLFKLGSKDTITTLVKGLRPPGNYTSVYNSTGLSNGIYTFHLVINNVFSRIDVVHQTYDYAVLFNTAPLAASNASGSFFLAYDALGVDRSFGSNYIVESIDIILYKQGYQVLKTGFTMDETKVIEKTFVLSK